jgi:4-amino-4-deoxy-L-arabinose transferase-like glycosyltransferase
MQIIRDLSRRHWFLLLLIALSFAWKAALHQMHAFSFNADEAIVALMAKHILLGERPLFFYGQFYMGSLDAWFVAFGFLIGGEQVWIIRAIQALLYGGTIALWYFFVLRISGSLRAARITALLMAIPPVLVTLYTTVSLGGYGEALLIGSLCLLLITSRRSLSPVGLFLQGALTGFGIWVFPLSLIYTAPAAVFQLLQLAALAASRRHRLCLWALWLCGLCAGGILWLIGLLKFGPQLIAEMSGSAISGTLAGDMFQILWIRILGLLLFGSTVVTGMRAPWEFRWLATAFLPFLLAIWIAAGLYAIRAVRKRDFASSIRILLFACLGFFAAVFLLTPFGNDPSGRYFLPLFPPCAVACAAFLDWLSHRARWLGWFCLGILPMYFFVGTLQCALLQPPGITTQFDAVSQLDDRSLPGVMAFLRAHGERRGYTNYWVSFPLAFLSDEELIFNARLPYHEDLRHTSRDNRYAPYATTVAVSDRVAYITTHNPLLDQRLEEAFTNQKVTFRVEQIGDYRIYYQLSRPIRPEEINLSVSTSY